MPYSLAKAATLSISRRGARSGCPAAVIATAVSAAIVHATRRARDMPTCLSAYFPLTFNFPLSPLHLLLGSTFVPLRDHRNRPHLRGVRDFVAFGVLRPSRQDEQRLLVLAAERARDDPARRRDHADVLAVGRDHLDAGTRRDEDVALRVDGHAVAAAGRELRVLALVGERPVRLDVERRE